jgi:hypothetical protein
MPGRFGARPGTKAVGKRLKVVLQSKLDQARRNNRCRDTTKSCRAADIGSRQKTEHWMVPMPLSGNVREKDRTKS